MKIRTNFVSNSSSSSFVLAISPEYELPDFARDVGKACTAAHSRYHDKNLAHRNRMVLEFCLSMHQAAFVGTLHVGDCKVDAIPVDTETMTYGFHRYGYDADDEADVVRQRVESIKRLALDSAERRLRFPQTFSITKASILNTRQLIAAGMDVDLGKFDLDSLDRRLDEGEKICVVKVSHQGDGYGTYSIYDETDGEWHHGIAAEILECECA